MSEIFKIAADEAKQMMMPTVRKIMEESLVYPQLFLLISVKGIIKSNNKILTFEEIFNHINNLNKKIEMKLSIKYSEDVFFHAFGELIKMEFLKTDISQRGDIEKGLRKTTECFLNIPLNELEEFLKDKYDEMPLAFKIFDEFLL